MEGGKVKKIVLLTAVCFCFLIFSVCAFATDDMREYFNSVGAKTNEIYDFGLVSREKAANFLDVFANAAGKENILKNGESVTVDESEYISALLTVLGYSESDGDFLFCLPYDKALSLGFVKPSDLENVVLMGEDVIEYSFRALAAKTKTGETLGEKAPFAGANYTELCEKYPTVSLASLPLVSLSGEIASEDFSASAVRDFKFDVKAVCDNTSHVIETYRTVDKYEETLKIGSTLCGFSFAGGPVSVVVSVKADTKTCEIYSEKFCEAVFEGGELKITLSEPQVIKAVFDKTNGITIGAGTDVAIDAADVVLMKSRALDIPASLCLGRAVLRNIHENLFWAFIYNIIGIPLAAGVFIPLFGRELNPMFGAAAMSLSSFCVVSNALRLNFINIYDFGKYKRSPKIKKSHKGEDKMEKTFNVEGMMCAHCEAHVKKALESIDGVKSATADHASGKVVVEFEKNVPDDEMIKAIKDAGYTVK